MIYIYINTYERIICFSQSVFICFSVLFLKSCEITDPEQAKHIIAHGKHSFSPSSTRKTVKLLLSNHCLTHWFVTNIWNGIYNSRNCIKSGQGNAQWLYALLSPYCMHYCESHINSVCLIERFCCDFCINYCESTKWL